MKKKLVINKKVIASLTDSQKARIIGGDGADSVTGNTCQHSVCDASIGYCTNCGCEEESNGIPFTCTNSIFVC